MTGRKDNSNRRSSLMDQAEQLGLHTTTSFDNHFEVEVLVVVANEMKDVTLRQLFQQRSNPSQTGLLFPSTVLPPKAVADYLPFLLLSVDGFDTNHDCVNSVSALESALLMGYPLTPPGETETIDDVNDTWPIEACLDGVVHEPHFAERAVDYPARNTAEPTGEHDVAMMVMHEVSTSTGTGTSKKKKAKKKKAKKAKAADDASLPVDGTGADDGNEDEAAGDVVAVSTADEANHIEISAASVGAFFVQVPSEINHGRAAAVDADAPKTAPELLERGREGGNY